MTAKNASLIFAIYREIENDDPDISTERLLAMTADRATIQFRRSISIDDVCDALEQTNNDPNP